MNMLVAWILKLWKILTAIAALIYLEDLRTDGEVDLPHLSFEYNRMRLRRLALKLKWKVQHSKISRKYLASLFFVCIMMMIYLMGDPAYLWFRAHWIPEMIAFAFLGLVFREKRIAWKRVMVLYIILIVAGLAMSWEMYEWTALLFSMLIAAPLLLTYGLHKIRR